MSLTCVWAWTGSKWLAFDPKAESGGDIKKLLLKLRLSGIPAEPGCEQMPPEGKPTSLFGSFNTGTHKAKA